MTQGTHMKRNLLLLLFAVGCATRPTVPQALDAANKALAGVDLAVEQSKAIVDAATDLKIESCSDKAPGEDRRECMGQLGKPIAPAYEKAGAAYDAAVDAIEAFKRAYEELQPFVDAAREEVN